MNICSKCQSQFEITPDDLLFYDKVSPIFNGKKFQIPPPTLCPDCRQKRRISFRNERTIYKRTCDRCQKSIISIYAPDKKFTVYCRECWWSEEIDLSNFSIEFDFNKTFTENYQRLSKQAPKVAIEHGDNLENSDFTNHTGDLKNCYLIFAALADEDCLYGSSINNSKNIIDGLAIRNSEICYECVDCIGNYDLMYSQNCANCNNGKFLYNCQSCSNCFLCSNLNNKSYCVRNQKYNREEYQKIMREINLADYSENKKIHSELSALKQSAVRKFINGYNNADCIGDQIFNTKNCKMCFELTNSEDCKFVSYGNGGKDTMDGYAVYPSTELSYEVVATGNNTYNSIFSYLPWTASNILYSNYTFPSCNDCFGCHYVHNQEYSILNKQYTKQEYEELVPRIIEHMQKSTPLSPPY
ncbi:MAG: hypothetical protein NTZ80_00810, partial [Patescibacteria group bacterium]|nr:hypothetical protein [Patescibacteria group bacterium]